MIHEKLMSSRRRELHHPTGRHRATPVAPQAKQHEAQHFNRYDPDFVYHSKKVPDITVRQLIDAALAVARSLG